MQLFRISNFIGPGYYAALLFSWLGSIVLLFVLLFSQPIREDLVIAVYCPKKCHRHIHYYTVNSSSVAVHLTEVFAYRLEGLVTDKQVKLNREHVCLREVSALKVSYRDVHIDCILIVTEWSE